jgi:hypothetical protein
MISGDLDSAKTVTHTKVTIINEDGTTTVDQVVESLDSPQKQPFVTLDPKRHELPELPNTDYEMDNVSPPPGNTKTYKVWMVPSNDSKTDIYFNFLETKGLYYGICQSH